jgi:hypothetical protein
MLHWNLHYCYIPDSKLLSICCSIRHVEVSKIQFPHIVRVGLFLENVNFVLVKFISFFVTPITKSENCATSLMFLIFQSQARSCIRPFT